MLNYQTLFYCLTHIFFWSILANGSIYIISYFPFWDYLIIDIF